MARLAAEVLHSVQSEANPKFKQSAFMDLMRQLRDGEVVVGETGVEAAAAAAATADVKGKGRALDPAPLAAPAAAPGMLRHGEAVPLMGQADESAAAVDPNDAYFAQENAEFQRYWAAQRQGGPRAEAQRTNAEAQGWSQLQESAATAAEAEASGRSADAAMLAKMRAEADRKVYYRFAEDNPYLARAGREGLGEMMRGRSMEGMSAAQRMHEVRGFSSRPVAIEHGADRRPRCRACSRSRRRCSTSRTTRARGTRSA